MQWIRAVGNIITMFAKQGTKAIITFNNFFQKQKLYTTVFAYNVSHI